MPRSDDRSGAGRRSRPTLIFTQGDPAGVGPELLLRLFAERGGEFEPAFKSIVVAERVALERYADLVPAFDLDALSSPPSLVLVDPVARPRPVVPGRPERADAIGAVAALERAVALIDAGEGDALVTLPVSKTEIARHVDPSFRGHTDWLAAAAGCGSYGRDYLMTFLAADLQVALLSTHVPLRDAIASLTTGGILDALRCLDRHAGGRIAVAGLNPHAGERGLLGSEDETIVRPAVERARAEGIDASGPWSPDSLFARARRGELDWVLALYHDQGLIAVKTASFGAATNWTLGLPFLRTSVDHGTAHDLAGTGRADLEPLRHVVATTLALLAGDLPRGRRASA
ncbi:MAG TPA: 4-hydroxythreonine-4-phosphate dehydrogenase PdxA [Thermoanaerobaculia bacterium]|nr:4-hydroxythreonine-4-phosphate dehydrogenase PdxA [Thermoanaerobaculia bacterium]